MWVIWVMVAIYVIVFIIKFAENTESQKEKIKEK